MKLALIVSAIALLAFASRAHALDKKKYEPIARGMMKFPDNPTETAFRAIEAKMAALPSLDYNSDDDQHVILISAAFLAGAHNRHHWPLGTKGEITYSASQLVEGKGKVAAWARNDKEVNADKLDYWWMAYLGSQDDAYLVKILKFAGDPTKYKDARALWVSLASLSFVSNCGQIKRVRAFAQRCLNDPAYKDRHEFLRQCLK